MAITAKKKAAMRDKELLRKEEPTTHVKRCTCLVAIRGRGQHAIDCALYSE